MKLYAIKEIAEIVSGSTPDTQNKEYWDGNIPWVTPKEISALTTPFLETTERAITLEGLRSCSASLLPKGSILFTSRAPIGLVAVTNIDVATNQGFKSLQLRKGFYPPYVYFALKHFSRRIAYLGTGTTFKELSKSSFENYQIPIPEDYEAQVKIATVLNRVDALIRKRNEALELSDEILRAQFQALFGNLVSDDLQWDQVILEKLVTTDCPLTYGVIQPGTDFPSGVPIVRPVDLKPIGIDFSDLKLIDPEISKKHKKTLLKGDEILMCVRGTTGICALATKDLVGCNVTRGIVPIRLKKKYDIHFIYQQLKSDFLQRQIKSLTYGSALKQINIGDLRQLRLINPPFELQRRFGAYSLAVMNTQTKMQQSLREMENAFRSLAYLAFEGNLNISKVKLREIDTLFYDNSTLSIAVEQGTSQIGELKHPSHNQKGEESLTKEVIGESKKDWEATSSEAIANWIKQKYRGYFFNSEMLEKYLLREHLNNIEYFSSEDLRKHPPLNSKEDFRKFITDALEGKSPFLKIRQHFHQADSINSNLKLTKEDEQLVANYSIQERSGVYFTIDDI